MLELKSNTQSGIDDSNRIYSYTPYNCYIYNWGKINTIFLKKNWSELIKKNNQGLKNTRIDKGSKKLEKIHVKRRHEQLG